MCPYTPVVSILSLCPTTNLSVGVRIADDMIACMREDGEDRARFIDALYGITRRPFGSSRYVFTIFGDRLHMSVAGLERWRENAVFTAPILAIQYGAIDLSRGACNEP